MAARAAAAASNSSAPSLAAARPSARPLGVVTSKIPGLNDGITRPESKFEPGQRALSAMRKVSLERPAPVDSDGIQHVRLLIILVEFEDQKIGTGKHEYFKDLFFSENKIESGSAAEYYKDVSNGKVQMSGDVVGPYKLPRSLVEYCNGDSGAVEEEPNAQTMARDALEAIMTDPVNPINISQYDSGDEDRFVDGLVIVHAGSGAEAEPDDRKAKNLIWSLQWNIGTPVVQDGVSAFAFLTIPEDALLGVTVHELGHLLFHWPDLYDPDNSSNGIGDWCLMAAGSWNALPGKPAGTKPAHPSGWCKLKQGWVEAVNVAENQSLTLEDVKASWQVHRLWENGDLRNKEYFLLENRQKTGYDTALPGDGLFGMKSIPLFPSLLEN
ncbi:putative m6 family metalloprotease domain-containing protein [Phaeoacremonium minimum UCRPA7]|uniref:Putative m6 family metalloprotease domain-containing protein n=1 Tax=Phaeoacremonium minimum (strain UCR-PA7) TaxID=1286976 RepID=R8BN72_PHAM7|nr:putative m6 family metalloprotease domain-containing protein [Phaeoacremonium minimum UCRPA7]EOO00782.1 putative m6 family metalloprotease domain-containing protein [Phaeoacremonium minimum UCRPA7]